MTRKRPAKVRHSPYRWFICEGPPCGCPVVGGPFAGSGAHKPNCPVGAEWDRIRAEAQR